MIKVILRLTTHRGPGTVPPLLPLIKPSFLNLITTSYASGEARLADSSVRVEYPSQRNGEGETIGIKRAPYWKTEWKRIRELPVFSLFRLVEHESVP